MVSHDVVAFDLLQRAGQPVDHGRAVRAGRRRGLRRLPLVPAAGRARPRATPSAAYAERLLRPRRRATWPGWSPTGTPWTATRAWSSSGRTCRAPGAETAVDAAPAPGQRDHARRRPGQARGQHVHGVGPGGARARSSTTTWSSSPRPARRSSSSPTAARACSRRSAGGSSRRRSSTGPRATSRCRRSPTSRARCSTWCATRWPATPPASAGLFRPEYVRELLADPNGELTPLARQQALAARACSSSGCRPTGSDGAAVTRPSVAGAPPAARPCRPTPAITSRSWNAAVGAPAAGHGLRRRPRPGLGPAGLRPDLRRPARHRRRAAGRGDRRARHLHLPARPAGAGRPGPRRAVHRPVATPTGWTCTGTGRGPS